MPEMFRDVIQGDLGDYNLADVLQFLKSLGKMGQLLIDDAEHNRSGGIYFQNGSVIHASCPPYEGLSAFYHLLTWKTGRFAFIRSAEPEQVSIGEDFQSLLLEGMRRIDEYQAAIDTLPSLSEIIYPVYDTAVFSSQTLNVTQWRLLEWIDGRRTIQELLELSGLNPVQAAQTISFFFNTKFVSLTEDYDFLLSIVPRRLGSENRTHAFRQPLHSLASHILRSIDGQRNLAEIQESLHCHKHDFVVQFRSLVTLRWVQIIQGQDLYIRFFGTC